MKKSDNETRPYLSEKQVRAILREYPDADAIASEEAMKSIAQICEKFQKE
jgi:nanoRNase/pAp phosphatase (c-di-AMP/oligoRNAs hydrolase)